MRMSGYGFYTRRDILKGVLDRSKAIEEDIRGGIRKRFRNRLEIKKGKDTLKGKHNNTWFLRGENTGVMMVQPTPNGELSKMVRNKISGCRAPDGGLTKVVEKGGKSIIAGLSKPDPFRTNSCPFPDKCWCTQKTDCWQARTVYRITCNTCGAQYTGTSAHSVHKRTWEHMEALRRGDQSNAISKHHSISHPEIDPRTNNTQLFKVEVLDRKLSNLERYIAAGIWIEDLIIEGNTGQLNSEGEWGCINTRRLTIQDNTDS